MRRQLRATLVSIGLDLGTVLRANPELLGKA